MERRKILVVDDESRMRKLVRDFLVKNNYDVLEAEDGEQAVELFFKEKGIALIVLDVMMPRMDGWQVCRDTNWRRRSDAENDEILPAQTTGGDHYRTFGGDHPCLLVY